MVDVNDVLSAPVRSNTDSDLAYAELSAAEDQASPKSKVGKAIKAGNAAKTAAATDNSEAEAKAAEFFAAGLTQIKSIAQQAEAGDQDAADQFSFALTGKTENELPADQKPIFRSFIKSLSNSNSSPNFVAAGDGKPAQTKGAKADTKDSGSPVSGADKTGSTGSTKTELPDGVLAAFVPGEDGEDGTVVFDPEILDSDDAAEIFLEEAGEFVGELARSFGLDVAPGDVGARMVQLVQGTLVMNTTVTNLFRSTKDDEVIITLNGRKVKAYARKTVDGVDFSPPKYENISSEATKFIIKYGETFVNANGKTGYRIDSKTLLENVDFPPEIKPTTLFIETFGNIYNTAANLPAGYLDFQAVNALFESRILYTVDDRPGEVFGDPGRIDAETITGMLGQLGVLGWTGPNGKLTPALVTQQLEVLFGENLQIPDMAAFEAEIEGASTVGKYSLEVVGELFRSGVFQFETGTSVNGAPELRLVVNPLVSTSAVDVVDGVRQAPGVRDPGLNFLIRYGSGNGNSNLPANYSISYDALRSAVGDGAPAKIPDSVLNLYVERLPNGNIPPNPTLGINEINAMLEDGVLKEYVFKNGPSQFSFEFQNIPASRIASEIFKPRANFDGLKISAATLRTELVGMFPNAQISSVAEIQATLREYGSLKSDFVTEGDLVRLIDDGAISIKLTDKGTVKIWAKPVQEYNLVGLVKTGEDGKPIVPEEDPTPGPRIGEDKGADPVSDTDDIEVEDDDPPTKSAREMAIAEWFETWATQGGNSDESGTIAIAKFTNPDSVMLEWNQVVPGSDFISLYRGPDETSDTFERNLSFDGVMRMFDDGVLSIDVKTGKVFGDMMNVDGNLIGQAIVRDIKKQNPDSTGEVRIGIDDLTTGLDKYLSNSLGEIILAENNLLSNLITDIVANRASPDDKSRMISAGELGSAFENGDLVIRTTVSQDGNKTIRIDVGPRINQAQATNPKSGEKFETKLTVESIFGDKTQLTYNELIASNVMNKSDAARLVTIFGWKGSLEKSVIGRQEFARLMANDEVSVGFSPTDQKGKTKAPVINIVRQSGADYLYFDWNNLRGEVLAPAIYRAAGLDLNAPASGFSVLEGIETLFGDVQIDTEKFLQIAEASSPEAGNKMSVGYLALLLDNDVIKFGVPDASEAAIFWIYEEDVTVTLNLEGLPESARFDGTKSLNSAVFTVDYIFKYDVNGDDLLEESELLEFFMENGASPNTGSRAATKKSVFKFLEMYGFYKYLNPARQPVNDPPSFAPEAQPTVSRGQLNRALEDGVIRYGEASSRRVHVALDGGRGVDSHKGAVLDLYNIAADVFVDRAMGGPRMTDPVRAMDADAFLDQLGVVTGDGKPLKEPLFRRMFKDAFSTPNADGSRSLTRESAIDALQMGLIRFRPALDGSFIETRLDFKKFLNVMNAESLFNYLDSDKSGFIEIQDSWTKEVVVDDTFGMSSTTEEQGVTPNKEGDFLIKTFFGIADDSDVDKFRTQFVELYGDSAGDTQLNREQFIEFIDALKTAGGPNFELGLGLAQIQLDREEDPERIPFGDVTRYEEDEEEVEEVDEADETGVESEEVDANDDVEAAEEEVVVERTTDGQPIEMEISIAAPGLLLNTPLEDFSVGDEMSGNPTLSELAIMDIYDEWSQEGRETIKGKAYAVHMVDTLRSQGLSAEDVGIKFSKNDLEGEELFDLIIDKEVYEQYVEELENDPYFQDIFQSAYREKVDKRFGQIFSIRGNKIVEGQGQPVSFSGLLERVGRDLKTRSNEWFATLTAPEMLALTETVELFVNFLKDTKPALVEEVMTRVAQGMAIRPEVNDAEDLGSIDQGVLTIDINQLTADEADTVEGIFFGILMDQLAPEGQGSNANGAFTTKTLYRGRRVPRLIATLASNWDKLPSILDVFLGNPRPGGQAWLGTLGFKPGDYTALKTTFNAKAFRVNTVKTAASVLGLISLAVRLGKYDKALLNGLKNGDMSVILPFMQSLGKNGGQFLKEIGDEVRMIKTWLGDDTFQEISIKDMEAEVQAVEKYGATEAAGGDFDVEALERLDIGDVQLSSASFKNRASVIQAFKLNDIDLRSMGFVLVEDAADAILDWYNNKEGYQGFATSDKAFSKTFIASHGNKPGAAQAVLISAMTSDKNYFLAFEANKVLDAADGDLNNLTAEGFAAKLKAGGMSKAKIDVVVYEAAAFNNRLSQLKDANPALNFELDAEGVGRDRFRLAGRLGEAWNGTGKVDLPDLPGAKNTGTIIDVQLGINVENGRVVRPDFYQRGTVRKRFGRAGVELPSSSHLRGGRLSTKGPNGGSTRVTMKGVKFGGFGLEGIGDVLGLYNNGKTLEMAINDKSDGKRALRIANSVVGLVHHVSSIANAVLTAGGGFLAAPVAILTGLTAVGQLVMQSFLEDGDQKDIFARNYVSQLGGFKGLLKKGAQDALADWYGKTKKGEQKKEEGDNNSGVSGGTGDGGNGLVKIDIKPLFG